MTETEELKLRKELERGAKAIPHELDMLKDVTAIFYGETLAAEIVKNYTRTPKPVGS